jgi:ATP-dependent Clp protease ATP-binding subunit ClpA
MVDPNRLTQKAREVLMQGQNLALKKHHQAVDIEHVAASLLESSDGRLTDSHGRTVDFKNTVIIMTSNIGSAAILDYQESDREDYKAMKETVLAALHKAFKPEFLNRVDEMVVFHALTREDLKKIVTIQLGYLKARLSERHIQLELTDKALEWVVKSGYNPSFGARPLKRTIQQHIENQLGKMIIAGEVKEGDKVIVDAEADELRFKV